MKLIQVQQLQLNKPVMPVHSIIPNFNNPEVYFGAYLSSDKWKT